MFIKANLSCLKKEEQDHPSEKGLLIMPFVTLAVQRVPLSWGLHTVSLGICSESTLWRAFISQKTSDPSTQPLLIPHCNVPWSRGRRHRESKHEDKQSWPYSFDEVTSFTFTLDSSWFLNIIIWLCRLSLCSRAKVWCRGVPTPSAVALMCSGNYDIT